MPARGGEGAHRLRCAAVATAVVEGIGVIPDAALAAIRNDRGERVSLPYASFTFFSGRLRTGLPVAA